MSKKVIVAGHICVDITPVFPAGMPKQTSVQDILQPGKLINMNGVQVSTGGVVANTGLAMQFLGADVKLIGKIGNDSFGEIVASTLKQHEAGDDSLIRDRNVATSYTCVIAIPGIDRIFLHSPGANDLFVASDITDEMMADCTHLHFGYPPLMRSFFINDGEELVKLYSRAKALGLSTSLDMAAVDPSAESGHANWKKILERTLPFVDFFVPSFEELLYMLDPERFYALAKEANGRDMTSIISFEKDVKPLAEECLALGAKMVVVKCGISGLYYKSGTKETMEQVGEKLELDTEKWANLEGSEASYVPSIVRSGTGAGDTSIAAFLTGLITGETPEMSFHLAAGTGASCVEGYDAFSTLRTIPELKEKIEAGWEKLSV